jgi:hypothetical protein
MSASTEGVKRYEFGAQSHRLRHRLPDGSCEPASLFSAYVLAADFDATVSRLQAELAEAKRELRASQEALETYGEHKHNCFVGHYNPGTGGPYQCNCGFDAALPQEVKSHD